MFLRQLINVNLTVLKYLKEKLTVLLKRCCWNVDFYMHFEEIILYFASKVEKNMSDFFINKLLIHIYYEYYYHSRNEFLPR